MIRIIAIAGPSGSGKTTIARKLLEHYGSKKAMILSCDGYYKDLSDKSVQEIKDTNFDHPDSLDLPLFEKHVFLLQAGFPVDVPQYDFITHTRLPAVTRVWPKDLIIVEGILVLLPRFLPYYDVKIYVKTDLDLCLLRRIQRDVKERGMQEAAVLKQYKETVRPMFKEYVEPSKKRADVVVKNNLTDLAFDMQDIIHLIHHVKEGRLPNQRHKLTLFSQSTASENGSESHASKVRWNAKL